jgi:hypothetical protein
MDGLAVISPTHTPRSTSHGMRLPLKNSRARPRAPGLFKKQDVVSAFPKNKYQGVVTEQLAIDDFRSAVLSQVSLWHDESDVIETESLAFEDMALPLKCVRGLLVMSNRQNGLLSSSTSCSLAAV